jgi:hypothetical protein
MAQIYVLYINDDIFGPYLELIRKVCEPDSISKPHVTITGPLRGKHKQALLFENPQISEIELREPGQFKSESQNTVFLLCDIQGLWKYHYKPDYFASPPHLTLYDGGLKDFARRLLDLLRSHKWGLRVSLPSDSRLMSIDLSAKKDNTKRGKFSRELQSLFQKVTGLKLEYHLLKGLSDDKRLYFVELIIEQMMEKVTGRMIVAEPATDALKIEQDHATQTLETLHAGYSSRQEELKLLQDSHTETLQRNPRDLRRILGQFLTPPHLAIDIMEYVRTLFPDNCPPIKFGDPSIGTGTFFSALRIAFPSASVASAIGVEIDKTVASITKRLWEKYGLTVVEKDYFRVPDLPKRNLVVSNPPYVRHHYIDKRQKESLIKRVKAELGIAVSGLSSLYTYFILLSHNWLEHGAICAWLIPSEFMETNYGAALRKYLLENVSLISVHRFNPKEVQFDGVIVSSSVIVFRNRPPRLDDRIKFTFGGNLNNPLERMSISVADLKRRNKWPTSPRLPADRDSSVRLRDLFIIKRGIATGANAFFIIQRAEAHRLGIPESFLRPILPSPRKLSEGLIKAEPDGYPQIDQQLVVIDCPLPEREVRKRHPKFWDYLKKAKADGVRESYLVKKRKLWYKQEDREPPLFLCTYLARDAATGRPFHFFWNRSKAIATNVYLLLYPREALRESIVDHPKLQKKVFDLLQQIDTLDLQDGGRGYGGGLFKLEPNELGSIGAEKFKNLINELGLEASNDLTIQ